MAEDGHARAYAREKLAFDMSMCGHGMSELFKLWLADTMRRECENGRPENALAAMREHFVGVHVTMNAMERFMHGILR